MAGVLQAEQPAAEWVIGPIVGGPGRLGPVLSGFLLPCDVAQVAGTILHRIDQAATRGDLEGAVEAAVATLDAWEAFDDVQRSVPADVSASTLRTSTTIA